MSDARVIVRLLKTRDHTPPGAVAGQPPTPVTVAPGVEQPRELFAWKRPEGISMEHSLEPNNPLYFSLQGVDLSDDDAIHTWAVAVWDHVMNEWKEDGVPADKPVAEATVPSTILTSRYMEAVAYASVLHGDQARKGGNITYLSHLLGVSALVLEAEGTETQAIAALLHDAAEDRGGVPRLAHISHVFGDDVARIVEGCSDSMTTNPAAKATWRERKEAHLEHLLSASDDIVVVTAADKLHNARAIVTDVQCSGVGYLTRFNAGSPADIVWYYAAMLQVLSRKRAPEVLLVPLCEAVYSLIDLLLPPLLRPNPDRGVYAASELAAHVDDAEHWPVLQSLGLNVEWFTAHQPRP